MSKKTVARRLAPLAALAVIAPALVVTGLAPASAADRTATLVGDLQHELGCAEDWAPACADTALQPTGAPGIYAAEFEIPEGRYEYKVAMDGSWDEAYGLEGGDDNIPLAVAGPAQLRFIFDDNLKRVGIEVMGLAGDHTAADDAIIAEPVRQAGADEQFYFVMTDRFADGDSSNNTGGFEGDRLSTGYDPTDKGFFHGGDLAGLHQQLDYIEGLGTTAIWLTPSFANKPVQGTGADASAGYHGYWITDFTRIDPHLGSNAELEALIDDAHARGIDVYFDIITNHTADVIDYAEGEYGYIDQATSPYTDADGATFSPDDYAGTDDFPALDPATSFPYTPVIADDEADLKVPSWLNDPTLYHNRGDSTWSGESVTYGDFSGLDDLMTEHPTVVDGFIEVYRDWIDLGIDGFRIDTVKHVNFEFWERWTTEVLDYAHAQGKDDFFMFGEVYDADPAKLAPYVRDTDMNSVLDFTFQSAGVSYASGNSAATLQSLFAGDDRYTTPDSSASALPTFLGNHDMGRVGHFLQSTDAPLERDLLAHELLFLTRGQPVVYYGDEQGFAGAGGDKDARQSLFATQVAEYADQNLITGERAGSVDRFDTDAVLYQHIAELSALRAAHPALAQGAQIQRYAESGPGVYAFSRVDADERIEYLVALNNSAQAQTVDLTTLTADASYEVLHGDAEPISSDAGAAASITVPALSAAVWVADDAVTAPADPAPVAVTVPAAGAGVSGQTAVQAAVADQWVQTSFAWREVGGAQWHPLGTAENTDPRVFHDIRGLAAGTLIEYRAVTTDAAGGHAAASTFASVGNGVTLEQDGGEEPGGTIDMVTVPGSLNSEMGCAGDWDPACEKAKLTLRADGIWEGTFDLPAGSYEYKAAINGSWDINYGVGGVPDGPNLTLSHEGGELSFYFDPRTNIIQTTADGPIVTLPGSHQDELGCAADWSPDCLATLMADPDGDGVYEFSTAALPTGAYELKVAHGMSWDENYGADGVRDGANIAFSATDGTVTSFRYTLETHVLEVVSENPPLPGTGELRAHWIDETTIAWPATLGAPDRAAYALYASDDASLTTADGQVAGADPIALTPIDGGLTDAQLERFPALAGYLALQVEDGADAAALLRTQLAVAQTDLAGELTAYTGVQIPGVVDDLYASALDGVELGAVFDGAAPTFRLWAPTAQQVELLTWDAGSDADPVRHEATRDDASGTWRVAGDAELHGAEFLWEVTVYAPSTVAIEVNRVTDPYSFALTVNSERSVAVDPRDEVWQPEQWRTAEAPAVPREVDRAIYELHIRDFSITDESVPEQLRGTYLAFAEDDTAGTAQLRELADAGINTVHLLPSFDIATIDEEHQAEPDCDLASYGPADTAQQACISAIAGQDGFNWGYDPYHYTVPEGSYATDAEGGARVSEFRSMVGALHDMGLQVVLDQVFNHTAESGQGARSVLDRVVPGYYHRLNAAGSVETSTCCQNVATEHLAAEKLMVDSIVTWARDYRVDGFRFDLMGHHSTTNMQAVRDALDELTLEHDGVDGSAVFLYGEGWNFGEVADNALFEQAVQGQLGGTAIGTFNDRLRDAVHGGSPVDSASTFRQGFGTGLGTDPNGDAVNGTTEEALADLGHETDLVKLGLAGNLRDYAFVTSDGEVTAGADIDYRGAAAGYADEPGEVINYVDAHDNETLYDLSVFKLPVETSMADRVRMNTLSLATVTFSQSPSFWHAGTELLRSKSLDRNSYDSGDWFNRIDWTGQESTFGSGLPMAADNQEKWPIMAPLLENEALKPAASDIAAAEAAALDLLRVRGEVGLLQLGSAALIQEKVSFPGSGADAAPGVIVMLIDDLVGDDVDPAHEGALVVFNASPEPVRQSVEALAGRDFVLTPALADGSDDVVKATEWDAGSGTITIPARSAAVLVDVQEDGGAPGPGPEEPGSEEPGDGDSDGDGGSEGGSDGGAGDDSDDPLATTGGVAPWLAALVAAMLLITGAALRVARPRIAD